MFWGFIWLLLAFRCYSEVIDVSLEAGWEKTPFKLNVLEAVSSYDQSLYQPLIEKLLGIEHDDDEPTELVFDENESVISDEQFFEYAMALIPSSEERSLVEIEIANKLHSPKIQIYYNHYLNDIKEINPCDSDLVLFEANSDIHYCETDAAFVLKTIENQTSIQKVKLPIDHVLGKAYGSNIYTIYGDFNDPAFRLMFFHLYQLVSLDKITLLWRYTPSGTTERELLTGYGVELNVKRTDYIAIDDRDFNEEQQGKLNFESIDFDIDQDMELTEQNFPDIKQVANYEFLNYQFTAYILHAKNKLKTLVDTLSEFPKFAFFIESQFTDIEELANIEGESRKAHLPYGLYINGAFITDLKYDFFEIFKAIKRELSFINLFAKLGINAKQSRDLMVNFADSVLQTFSSPNKRYKINNFKKLIGYVNDIESDSRYDDFLPTREVYRLTPPQGQLPLAKENIFDIVFVLDLANKLQLQYFIECADKIISSRYPIRIGVVPLRDVSEYSEMATKKFYGALKTQGPSEALTFLNMFNMFINSNEGLNRMTFRAMHAPYIEGEEKELVYSWLDQFYKDFNINQNEPLIIADGVILPYGDLNLAIKQLFDDMADLLVEFNEGLIPEKAKFKDYLRRNAIGIRNPTVIPNSLGGFRSSYVRVPDERLYTHRKTLNTLVIDRNVESEKVPITLNLVGSIKHFDFLSQVKHLIQFAKDTKNPLRVVISDISDSKEFEQLLGLDIEELIDKLQNLKIKDKNNGVNSIGIKTWLSNCFDISEFSDETIYMFIAGRQISLTQVLSTREINALVNYELFSRLRPINKLIQDVEFSLKLEDRFDRFDYISWVISSTYFYEQSEYFISEAMPRLDTSRLPSFLRIDSEFNNPEAKLEVKMVIDPVSEVAQKFVSYIPFLESLDFVHLSVFLAPETRSKTEPLNRFYKGLYSSKVDFNSDNHVTFQNVPKRTLFNIGIDDPQRWLVSIKEANTDLDNIKLDLMNDHKVTAVYQLKNILVEGYAFYEGKPGLKIAPAALEIELVNENDKADTNVMANYGYYQLKANPGHFNFQIKKNSRGNEIFELVSNDSVWVTELDGNIMSPQFRKKKGKENVELIQSIDAKSDDGFLNKASKYLSSLFKSKDEEAQINIFSVASGHLYERFLAIMTASVMKNTSSTVKFWFIENYMSPDFKSKLPLLSSKYGFEYELLMYKWPIWLHHQRERQRTIWGYKILFLDVLFPQDLSRVIYVDADQVVRTDMYDLMQEDLEGAPYGYTPMCDSREEMEGFRFWKKGYWQEVLGDKYKYHISALYVVDLDKFRDIAAGDLIRQHYRQLSRDPESLSNLDQDLPNSLQHYLPIHSLDQSWLWCETWCADESLKNAKTIDLCNNPLTKEPKLDRARRQITEWTPLDLEISSIFTGEALDEGTSYSHDEL